MKKFMFLLLLTSCNIQGTPEQPVIGVVSTINRNYDDEPIYLYVIDGCEYIGQIYPSQSDFLTHKGNCKYCAERKCLNQ